MYSTIIVESLREEIALEGLDGITLEALWKRLASRSDFNSSIDEFMKNCVWKIVNALNHLEFFELAEPRPELDEENLNLVYPLAIIEDGEIKGSCSTYHTRKKLESEFLKNKTLTEVDKEYGNKLVIVASQESRTHYLFGESYKNSPLHLMLIDYVILEKTGRSRAKGLLSIGAEGLDKIISDKKSLNYHLKKLIRSEIVLKTMKPVRSGNNNVCVAIYLPRYFKTPEPNTELIGNILDAFRRNNGVLPAADFVNFFPTKRLAKIFRRQPIFQQSFKSKRMLSSAVYPEMKDESNPTVKKHIPAIIMVNKDVAIRDFFTEELVEEDVYFGEKGDLSEKLVSEIDLPFSVSVLKLIHSSGKNGISVREIHDVTGRNSKLIEKIILKNVRTKRLSYYMKEAGAQRARMFVDKCYAKNEMEKFKKKSNENKNEKEVNISGLTSQINSVRKEKRLTIIKEVIETERLIEFRALLKYIRTLEEKEGLQFQMQKKTLRLYLQEMVNENLFRCLLLPGPYLQTKNLIFYIHKDLSSDDPLVLNQIERYQQLYSETVKPEKKRKTPATVAPKSVVSSINDSHLALKQLTHAVQVLESNEECELVDLKIPKKTRFESMRLVHQLLCYLVHCYNGSNEDQGTKLQRLIAENYIEPELRDKMPTLYTDYVSWRMFIPPLPNYGDRQAGFCLVADFILRVPLMTFVTLLSITQGTEELDEFLKHPVKRNFLLFDLPLNLRYHLFKNRLKQITILAEEVKKLCQVGLVRVTSSFGKLVDMAFVYINKLAVIKDTRSSEPGYMFITNKPYNTLNFEFVSMKEVDNYWTTLCEVCLSTPLNSKSMRKKELSEPRDRKLSGAFYQACIQSISEETCFEEDKGFIPGDGRGAAGLDSILFAHLQSNWMRRESTDLRVKREKAKVKETIIKEEPVLKPKCPKSEKKVTKLKEKQSTDSIGLKMPTRLHWSTHEDNILFACIAAKLFFVPYSSSHVIKYTDLRDILHKCSQESKDKTSLVIKRRILLLMRNASLRRKIDVFVKETKQNSDLLSKFETSSLDLSPDSPGFAAARKQVVSYFHEVFHYIRASKWRVESGTVELPDTLDEFHNLYTFGTEEEEYELLDRPTLETNIVRSVIMSHMCSVSDKVSHNSQLMRIYNAYDHSVSTAAVRLLRDSQIISIRKLQQYNMNKNKKGLPISRNHFSLSQKFHCLFIVKYKYTLFEDCFDAFERALRTINDRNTVNTEMEVNIDDPISTAFCIQLLDIGGANLSVKPPDQALVIDPSADSHNNFTELINTCKKVLQDSTGRALGGNSTYLMRILIRLASTDDSGEEPPSKRPRLVDVDLEEEIKKAKHMIKDLVKVTASADKGNIVKQMNESFVIKSSKISISFGNSLGALQKSMENYKQIARKIEKKYVLDPTLPDESILDTAPSGIRENVKSCYSLICSYSRTGTDLKELVSLYSNQVHGILDFLLSTNLVVKVGINNIRIVAFKFSEEWLVNTVRQTKLQREKRDDLNTGKRVKLLIRPWVRVDGRLNRKVLDRFLSTILAYILQYPGIYISDLTAKFYPGLTGVEMRELLDLLVEFGCIVIRCCYVIQEATLFDEEKIVFKDELSGDESHDILFVEPKPDAILQLSLFIGKKLYAQEFINV